MCAGFGGEGKYRIMIHGFCLKETEQRLKPVSTYSSLVVAVESASPSRETQFHESLN